MDTGHVNTGKKGVFGCDNDQWSLTEHSGPGSGVRVVSVGCCHGSVIKWMSWDELWSTRCDKLQWGESAVGTETEFSCSLRTIPRGKNWQGLWERLRNPAALSAFSLAFVCLFVTSSSNNFNCVQLLSSADTIMSVCQWWRCLNHRAVRWHQIVKHVVSVKHFKFTSMDISIELSRRLFAFINSFHILNKTGLFVKLPQNNKLWFQFPLLSSLVLNLFHQALLGEIVGSTRHRYLLKRSYFRYKQPVTIKKRSFCFCTLG